MITVTKQDIKYDKQRRCLKKFDKIGTRNKGIIRINGNQTESKGIESTRKEQDTQVQKGKKCNRGNVFCLSPCKQKYVNIITSRSVVKHLVGLKMEV